MRLGAQHDPQRAPWGCQVLPLLLELGPGLLLLLLLPAQVPGEHLPRPSLRSHRRSLLLLPGLLPAPVPLLLQPCLRRPLAVQRGWQHRQPRGRQPDARWHQGRAAVAAVHLAAAAAAGGPLSRDTCRQPAPRHSWVGARLRQWTPPESERRGMCLMCLQMSTTLRRQVGEHSRHPSQAGERRRSRTASRGRFKCCKRRVHYILSQETPTHLRLNECPCSTIQQPNQIALGEGLLQRRRRRLL